MSNLQSLNQRMDELERHVAGTHENSDAYVNQLKVKHFTPDERAEYNETGTHPSLKSNEDEDAPAPVQPKPQSFRRNS